MYPPVDPSGVPGSEQEPRGPGLRSVVRKSVLLNLTIVLTSFPVLVFAGGPAAVIPVLAIMAGISVLIWSTTFALFSFVSLARIFWSPATAGNPDGRSRRRPASGLADRWLDEPV